jgi:hypothetical protein
LLRQPEPILAILDDFGGRVANMTDRFPAPWSSEKIPGGYAVRDAERKVVAHIYGQDAPINVSKALTLDEAREMATYIAKLPDS